MIIRKADAQTEGDDVPTEELIEQMGNYNEAMVKAGVMLSGDGLMPSRTGARVKFRGGKPTVIDGPFTETKELVAGFSIIEVASKDEAIEAVAAAGWQWRSGDRNPSDLRGRRFRGRVHARAARQRRSPAHRRGRQ